MLIDQRTRFAFAVVVAVCWYAFAVSSEAGRNAAPVVIAGVPGVLVLLWWRTRPLLTVGLSFLALIIVLVSVAGGTPANGGQIVILMTGWFAMLGAFLTNERLAWWAAATLLLVDALLTLGSNGGPGFIIVAFFGFIAIGSGWGWRQLRANMGLRTDLDATTERGRAAERDVLLELERNRLAREVHDVVAHSLAVVIAQADGARFAAESKPETVAPALEAISDTARRALGEVRTMLHDLRTSGEGGVVPGADDLTGLVEGVRGLGVEVEEVAFGEPRALSRPVGLAMYRIAQEALTNAMRHGDRTAPVGFEVDWGEREVVLVVTNAVPDEAVPASERAGHGVTGMRERAADAGGDCSAGVGSNGRYRVRVALPIADEAADQPEQEPAETNPLVALLAAAGLQPRA